MAKDAFGEALDGFQQWLQAADEPGDDAKVAVEEARLLLDLMQNYLEIGGPAELTPAGLREILLRVYPRKVVVLPGEETDATIQVARDLVTYLGQTRAMPEPAARALEGELDDIAPRFADALTDPSNWTPSRSFAQAMAEAEVDITDRSAVRDFIETFNASLEQDLYDEDDEFTDIDAAGIELKEAFGLPDELPPMRVPADAELAAQARQVPVVAQLRALAEWLGEGREVTEDGDLGASDAKEAAAAIGIDVEQLPYLWDLALETEFAEFGEDETLVVPGDTALDWESGDDQDVLDTWQLLLGAVMAGTLDVAASLDPHRAHDLDFFAHGTGLVVVLFLGRAQGVPVAEVSQIIEHAATDQLPPGKRAAAWQSWVQVHGDIAKFLLGQLVGIGAARLTPSEDDDEGELAWLTPLALSAMRDQFIQAGVNIPRLPPPEELTAQELIAMAAGSSEEEFNAETAAWFAHRTPESAAHDLLATAVEADGPSRLLAIAVTTEIGAAAGPAWRAALDSPPLRGYAKAALANLDGHDVPEDLALEDMAWILTDTLAAEGLDDTDDDAWHDPVALASLLGEAVPHGEEQNVFEAMARLPHSQVAAVLTVIGRHHPDKKVAKAARKAAYKATTRQVARKT